tara:strand:- start:137 stop:388 length:252 start_codon:yes stop_codon:yes gene_type:complete
MTFENLKFEGEDGDIQAIVTFRNGYEVSVVQNGLSYGGDKGLYEIGVFDASGGMCDPLGWGDEVKGWLNPEDVEKELDLIASL